MPKMCGYLPCRKEKVDQIPSYSDGKDKTKMKSFLLIPVQVVENIRDND